MKVSNALKVRLCIVAVAITLTACDGDNNTAVRPSGDASVSRSGDAAPSATNHDSPVDLGDATTPPQPATSFPRARQKTLWTVPTFL